MARRYWSVETCLERERIGKTCSDNFWHVLLLLHTFAMFHTFQTLSVHPWLSTEPYGNIIKHLDIAWTWLFHPSRCHCEVIEVCFSFALKLYDSLESCWSHPIILENGRHGMKMPKVSGSVLRFRFISILTWWGVSTKGPSKMRDPVFNNTHGVWVSACDAWHFGGVVHGGSGA